MIIAEVTLSDTDKTGLTALNLTAATNATTGVRSVTNFSGAVAGWNITEGIVDPLSLKAALTDAGTRSNVNVLSAPTIVTTHNKEAQVVVGQKRPVVTGTTSVSTTGGTSSTYTYQSIAIDLKVTPLIGDDGSIQLKIDQKVDDLLGSTTIDGNQVPIIGTRQATSFINVYDNQMVVLGGLQRQKFGNDRAKIGFLAEIPIISQLLGGREKSRERTELLLFVRPHVIKPSEVSADAKKNIDGLSNKEQINQYLIDPSKPAKPSLIEQLK